MKIPHMESLLQQELCRMYSSEFNQVTKIELTPFMAVMRLIKVEYSRSKPEVYKMIVAILHDYNPNFGELHRQKTIRYIRTLLSCHPDLADFLVNILPKTILCKPNIPISGIKRIGDVQLESNQPSKRVRKENVKCYNYTPPVVSAYVASQGVPAKITSLATTNTNISTSLHLSSQTALPVVSISRLGGQITTAPFNLADVPKAKIIFPGYDVDRCKPLLPRLSNPVRHIATAASCAPRVSGMMALEDLRSIVESRTGLDLRSVAARKREEDEKSVGKLSDSGDDRKEQVGTKWKNEDEVKITSTDDVPDHDSVIKAFKIATKEKFVKVKIRNPKDKVKAAATSKSGSGTNTLSRGRSPQMIVIPKPMQFNDILKRSISATDLQSFQSGRKPILPMPSSVFPSLQAGTFVQTSFPLQPNHFQSVQLNFTTQPVLTASGTSVLPVPVQQMSALQSASTDMFPQAAVDLTVIESQQNNKTPTAEDANYNAQPNYSVQQSNSAHSASTTPQDLSTRRDSVDQDESIAQKDSTAQNDLTVRKDSESAAELVEPADEHDDIEALSLENPMSVIESNSKEEVNSTTTVNYTVEKTSSAFPYKQQITLSSGKTKNFVIDRVIEPKTMPDKATKVWTPPVGKPIINASRATPWTKADLENRMKEKVEIAKGSFSEKDLQLSEDTSIDLGLSAGSSPSSTTSDDVSIMLDVVNSSPDCISIFSEDPVSGTPQVSDLPVSPDEGAESPSAVQCMESPSAVQCMESSTPSAIQSMDSPSAVADLNSEEEHLLLLSQMDGTSDHGDFSQPGSYIDSLSNSPSLEKLADITSPLMVMPSDDEVSGSQSYTPLTAEAAQRLDYLSRLLDTPSPPDFTNPWGITPVRKRPRQKPQGQTKRRRKVRK